MKKRELIHPRKAVWAMRDFINEIHNLTFETIIVEPGKPDETAEEWYERFRNAESLALPATCKMVKLSRENFCAFTGDEGGEEFRIGYNFNAIWSKDGFRETCTSRSPVCKGFANITLILLHELGHFSSQQSFEDYNREEEIEFLNSIPHEVASMMYFLLPDEMSATDWAVEWLQDAEHRRIAKAFEKKFFACFK